jgi:hypothetical protein
MIIDSESQNRNMLRHTLREHRHILYLDRFCAFSNTMGKKFLNMAAATPKKAIAPRYALTPSAIKNVVRPVLSHSVFLLQEIVLLMGGKQSVCHARRRITTETRTNTINH